MAEPQLTGAHPQIWLGRLETEHNNLRAAIQWAIESRSTELALRLGAALWRFWWKHGCLSEGQAQQEVLLARAMDNTEGICCCFEGLACAAALDGQAVRAAQFLGAADLLHKSIGFVIDPDQQLVVDRAVERSRAQLGEEAFVTAWETGRAMPLEQAIAYAKGTGG
jgi:hypothetical protein